MALTLDEILDSKIYVKPNAAVMYKSPQDYLGPFLDLLSKKGIGEDSITVKASEPVTNANEDSSINTSYARVLIEADLGMEADAHDSVLGLVYALDTGKPIIKTYAGKNARACLNLTIFNAKDVFAQELTSNVGLVYEKSQEYLDKTESEIKQFLEIVDKLKNTYYDQPAVDRKIGEMLRMNLGSKLGTNPIVFAAREIHDMKSKYSVDPTGGIDAYKMMNAVTQFITDKSDIADKADKTLLATRLFLN